MFIEIRYGNNESLLCNPKCAVVNLMMSIKHRTGYGNSNFKLDLSDETGLVKEMDNFKNEYATKHLSSQGVYVLVRKIPLALDEEDEEEMPRFEYIPLLERYIELFPNYQIRVAEADPVRPVKHLKKNPSPAGRFPTAGVKSKNKVALKTGSTRKK